MSTYQEANEIEFFNECIDDLAKEVFHDDNRIPLSFFDRLDEKVIRKSAWVASILASSPDQEHKKKALAFAILAYSKHRETDVEKLYERYLYVILSRIGDLPAIGSFVDDNERQEYDQSLLSTFDTVLSLELDSYRDKFRYENEGYLSEFQFDVHRALAAGQDVAISGPTSSGKSFLLQQYIEEKVEQDDDFEVIYVVPTRALIAEVSAKLKRQHAEVTVKTSANFTEDDEQSNIFLVVTPERCLKLFQEGITAQIDPDLIFFDEIQNIEEGERGVLYENVLESLRDIWPKTQFVVAGPYLDSPDKQLERITGNQVTRVTTVFTPILQLKIYLTFEGQSSGVRQLNVTIVSPTGEQVPFAIPEPSGLTLSQYHKSKGVFLRKVLHEFGADDQNLIYVRRKDWAERWAGEIAQGNPRNVLSADTRQLREFLADTVHADYTLIDCLERGVAFHHRMVPKIARTKIEEIYRNENFYDIDTIVCTSTLLQGVNFPAKNIFVHDPSKGREDLTDFEFKNLIGRVGRLNQNLYGSIYCIQTKEEEWAEEKLSDDDNKEIVAVTDQAIQTDFEKLIEVVNRENIYTEEESRFRYTGILLRNKHLRGGGELQSYLRKKEVGREDAQRLENVIEKRLSGIAIPEKILRRNPTIDPVQQDELYKAVRRDPTGWIIAENRRGYDYEDFFEVTRKLNDIFLFANDDEIGFFPPNPEVKQGDIEPIIANANRWLLGQPFRDMIEARQNNNNVDDSSVNVSIRKVMEIVNDDIQFVLVKYFRILTDILEETGTDNQWMSTFDQMLEMGSLDFQEIELMSMGVDRSVVIDLSVPPNVEDIVDWLQNNRQRIPPFYQDHLEDQGIL